MHQYLPEPYSCNVSFGHVVEHGHHTTLTPPRLMVAFFVAGVPVKGGFYGEEPSLTDLDHGDLKFTTDFRDVYFELLQRTVGTDPTPSVGTGRNGLGFL